MLVSRGVSITFKSISQRHQDSRLAFEDHKPYVRASYPQHVNHTGMA